jgi:hypothetical protein
MNVVKPSFSFCCWSFSVLVSVASATGSKYSVAVYFEVEDRRQTIAHSRFHATNAHNGKHRSTAKIIARFQLYFQWTSLHRTLPRGNMKESATTATLHAFKTEGSDLTQYSHGFVVHRCKWLVFWSVVLTRSAMYTSKHPGRDQSMP